MHHICNDSNYTDFNSFVVEGDFIEAPSQMLEYWCKMPEALALMSRHTETGESIGVDLVTKLRQSATVGLAMTTAKQVSYALMDMILHTSADKIDLGRLFIDTVSSCTGITIPEGTNMFGSFGHMMGGYAAGYYGYQWSLVCN
jgi:Zn-dependent oligopeptidase